MSDIDHYRSTVRNLAEENARLKRQLDKAVEGAGGCPTSVGLTNTSRSISDCPGMGCRECWHKALEEVE